MLEPVRHSALSDPDDQPASLTVRVLLAVMIVGVLVVVGGGTAWWIYSQKPTDQAAARPAGPCPDTVLHVVAAPEIAPVVREAARTLNGGGDCGPVGVTAQDPVVTASAPEQPDVWIPSSSAWLRISLVGGVEAYRVDGDPIARSPIVIAGPTAIAGRYAKGDQTTWMQLMAGVAGHQIPAVTMPDPLHSTVGMLAVYAIQTAMASSTPDAGIAQLRALTLRSRLKDASADPGELLQRVASATDPTAVANGIGVFPITEQQLITYQHGGHAIPLTGSFPSDGLIEADYPFAISSSTEHADLAVRLHAAIGKPMLTEAGFRTYAMAHTTPVPERTDKLLGPAVQWAQYRALAFQVLLLIDDSGSMNKPATDKAGRPTTKAALLRQSGLAATQVLGDETSVGMWFFNTPNPKSPPHSEVVPFGPINAKVGAGTRRAAMATAINGYQAPNQAGTPLFQTILDAQAAMRPRVAPNTITMVIVLTDGTDGESTYSMPKKTFLDRLAKSQDPERPVPVIGVGFGPDADMSTLTTIAHTTDGKAIAARNPADLASALAKAFLAAHAVPS
ncbi:substrate-binding and VWA domain-containing protein [Actinoplanes sp. KI2]|uniref:substrate-binding and VWA domain-containing protein n=1 Tax=Actinoplanes sp. KI2 TaxID=2983315 RepID=UPI0021D5F61F|nr:substrate-binding and VWA domain-containing protein [Actinoplanes sp. KI2]MCU7731106.1 substrate-binding and VWA domain-containing protein [Actinoplanes sp. KI2]